MRADLDPMLAQRGLPRGDLAGWAVEPKLDGWRLLVTLLPTGVKARTRRGNTLRVPVLGGLTAMRVNAVLDGELVAGAGRARDFYQLMPAVAAGQAGGLAFMAFDILQLDDEVLTARPYRERRAILESLAIPAPCGTVPRFAATDAGELLALCAGLDLEGVVLKREQSTYRCGERSRHWRKVKSPGWAERHAQRRRPER